MYDTTLYRLPTANFGNDPPLLESDTISNLTFHTPPPNLVSDTISNFTFYTPPTPNFPNFIRFEELFSKNGIFFVKNSNLLVKNGMFKL